MRLLLACYTLLTLFSLLALASQPDFLPKRSARPGEKDERAKEGSILATLKKLGQIDVSALKFDKIALDAQKKAATSKPSEFGNNAKTLKPIAAGHQNNPTSFSYLTASNLEDGTDRGADGTWSSTPFARPPSQGSDKQKCSKYDIRIPWSTASRAERKAWMAAIRCTFTIPGTFVSPNGRLKGDNMAEDFALAHNYLTLVMHQNPGLLPCHRAFVLTWLKKMRKVCDYDGPTIYMDWTTYADKNELGTSDDLWGADYLGALACPVDTGIFSDVNLRLIGSKSMETTLYPYEHQMCRNVKYKNEDGQRFELYLQSDTMAEVLDGDDFETFYKNIQEHQHGSIHRMFGGDMRPNTSPQDPACFFGHHLWLDCVWAQWQRRNNGRNTFKYSGHHALTGAKVNLNQQCVLLNLGPDYTVIDMMDSESPPNCFRCKGLEP